MVYLLPWSYDAIIILNHASTYEFSMYLHKYCRTIYFFGWRDSLLYIGIHNVLLCLFFLTCTINFLHFKTCLRCIAVAVKCLDGKILHYIKNRFLNLIYIKSAKDRKLKIILLNRAGKIWSICFFTS